MTTQKAHFRTSKNGKRFKAGKTIVITVRSIYNAFGKATAKDSEGLAVIPPSSWLITTNMPNDKPRTSHTRTEVEFIVNDLIKNLVFSGYKVRIRQQIPAYEQKYKFNKVTSKIDKHGYEQTITLPNGTSFARFGGKDELKDVLPIPMTANTVKKSKTKPRIKYTVVLKNHTTKETKNEVFYSDEDILKGVGDVGEALAGPSGYVWDKYDVNEWYADDILEEKATKTFTADDLQLNDIAIYKNKLWKIININKQEGRATIEDLSDQEDDKQVWLSNLEHPQQLTKQHCEGCNEQMNKGEVLTKTGLCFPCQKGNRE